MLAEKLQNVPSNMPLMEVSRIVPELDDSLDILLPLFSEYLKDSNKTEIDRLESTIERLEEQIYNARMVLEEIKAISTKKPFRYNETKELVKDIARLMEDSGFEF